MTDIALKEQLATTQAHNKMLRDALLEESNYQMRNDAEVAIWIKEALSEPTDDTALKAALAAERERCCSIVSYELGDHSYLAQVINSRIRALEN